MKRNPPKVISKFGVEWTGSLERDMIAHVSRIDCLELIPENFFRGKHARFLKQLASHSVPVLIHSVELSLGTDEPLKRKHFEKIQAIASQVNTLNFSDHLCMTEAGGIDIGQLTPLPWTNRACDVACRKIEQIQSRLSVPFLIENITNRFVYPENELTETEFINKILRRTGCGLLLDLNNVYTNAINFNFDPLEWVASIDLDRVNTIHLAGGFYDTDGDLVDSHSASVPDAVWELYHFVCSKVQPPVTIVEWTDNVPPYESLLADVEKARAICLRPKRATRNDRNSRAEIREGAFL